MIEFAFIYDRRVASQLVVMTLMLGLFMLNVPVLIAFTVARYETTDGPPAPGDDLVGAMTRFRFGFRVSSSLTAADPG